MKTKLTRFFVHVPSLVKPGSEVAVNTYTGAMLRIPRRMRELLEAVPEGSCLENLSALERVLPVLKQHGFAVRADLDESDLVDSRIEAIRHSLHNLAATVLVTNQCNLRCPFCFEQCTVRDSNKAPMNREIAARVADWLVEWSILRGANDLDIGYYGGEPLMALDRIELLSERIRSGCGAASISVRSSTVTNGTLLTPETAQRLRRARCHQVQVSFEGPAFVHNARRPNSREGGSFEKSIEGVAAAIDAGMAVVANIIFDPESEKLQDELLDAFERFRGCKQFVINPSTRIMWSFRDRDAGTGDLTADQVLKLGEAFGTHVPPEFYIKAAKRGFYVTVSNPIRCCPRESGRALFIEPTGDLYNCELGLGTERYHLGNVMTAHPKDVVEQTSPEKLGTRKTWARCRACAYYPQCGSPCRTSQDFYLAVLGHEPCKRDDVHGKLIADAAVWELGQSISWPLDKVVRSNQ